MEFIAEREQDGHDEGDPYAIATLKARWQGVIVGNRQEGIAQGVTPLLQDRVIGPQVGDAAGRLER